MQNAAKSARLVPIGYKTRLDEKLKYLLDALPVGVSWARIEDGRIEFMNRRLGQMLGYSVEDVPTVFAFFDTVFADERQREMGRAGAMRIVGGTQLQESGGQTTEVELRSKDGQVKTMAFGGIALPDAGWLVATFLDLTDRKERERLAMRLAEEDPLTGLLNRRSFDAALSDAIAAAAPGGSVHLVLLDLDGFKAVNDTAGHEAGDRVLKVLAGQLMKVMRRGDLLARIGGDEFAAIIAAPGGANRVQDLLSRISAAFARPVQIDERRFTIGASIGVARFPQDAGNALDLYKSADREMYRAKAAHKSRP